MENHSLDHLRLCKRDPKKCIQGIYNYHMLSNQELAESLYFQEIEIRTSNLMFKVSDEVSAFVYAGYEKIEIEEDETQKEEDKQMSAMIGDTVEFFNNFVQAQMIGHGCNYLAKSLIFLKGLNLEDVVEDL